MVDAGQLHRLARALREVALAATAAPGEEAVPLSLVMITDDIAQHGATTVGEIAGRTGLAQSLVSRTVDELRQGGIVRSRRDDADRRRTLLSITARARTDVFAARAERGVGDALRDRFPHLDARRLAAVEKHLDAVLAVLHP